MERDKPWVPVKFSNDIAEHKEFMYLLKPVQEWTEIRSRI